VNHEIKIEDETTTALDAAIETRSGTVPIVPIIFRRYIPSLFLLLWRAGFNTARFDVQTAEPVSFRSICICHTLSLFIIALVFSSLKAL